MHVQKVLLVGTVLLSSNPKYVKLSTTAAVDSAESAILAKVGAARTINPSSVSQCIARAPPPPTFPHPPFIFPRLRAWLLPLQLTHIYLKVHVRLWGQHFTEAAWGGVLEALRAAPAPILAGATGQVAGVPKLLEAYVNLVAMQVRVARRDSSGEVVSFFL